jgi:tetratricopeptide (TPR) repeat protein
MAAAAKERGNAYFKEDKWTDAILSYTQAIDSAGSDDTVAAASYLNRGVCHKKLGELEKAMNDLNKAIEIKPTYAKALHHRGSVHDAMGRAGAALKDYNAVKKLEPAFKGIDADIETAKTAILSLRDAALDATSSISRTSSNGATASGAELAGNSFESAASSPCLSQQEYDEAMRLSKSPMELSGRPSKAMQRFNVARFFAQYQRAGLSAKQRFCVVPSSWWRSWCEYVGGFSAQSDVAPCIRLLGKLGTLKFEMHDPVVRSEYEVLTNLDDNAGFEPAPIDMRSLVRPYREHILPIPLEFLKKRGETVSLVPEDMLGDSHEFRKSEQIMLRQDVREGEDFELVGWQIAEMLGSWYGRVGPLIVRAVCTLLDEDGANEMSAKARLVIDLYPEQHRYDGAKAAFEAISHPLPSKTSVQHACAVCGKPNASVCSKCHNVAYCGQVCQKAHWKVHKTECGTSVTAGSVTSGLNGRVGLHNLGNTW